MNVCERRRMPCAFATDATEIGICKLSHCVYEDIDVKELRERSVRNVTDKNAGHKMTIDEAIEWLNTDDYNANGYAIATKIALDCMKQCKRIFRERPISTRGYCEYSPDCTCDEYANGYNECLAFAKGVGCED